MTILFLMSLHGKKKKNTLEFCIGSQIIFSIALIGESKCLGSSAVVGSCTFCVLVLGSILKFPMTPTNIFYQFLIFLNLVDFCLRTSFLNLKFCRD